MGFSFHELPRHVTSDIFDRVLAEEYSLVTDILALRLVDKRFNAEIIHRFYDLDETDIHYRILIGICRHKPIGVSLQRLLKGFISRPKGDSDILNSLSKSLRDGALIFSVIDKSSPSQAVVVKSSMSHTRAASIPLVENEKNDQIIVESQSTDSDEEEAGVSIPEDALLQISKAYINILGEATTFESIDHTWQRDPDKFAKLDEKQGHFWAFLAAAYDGTPDLIRRAIKACKDHFRDEADDSKVKMHLAAGLLITAKQGDIDAAETILAEPAAHVSLRFQNIRFAGVNAMEVAIESSQVDIVRLFLRKGWNLTTVPADYVRSLKATLNGLKDQELHDELLSMLLESDCEQWRSESITNGMFQEISKRGDLRTCQKVLALLKEVDSTQFTWQWTFTPDRNNDHITVAPVTSTDPDEEPDFMHQDMTPPEEKTALYQAVINSHDEIIPFLLENRKLFPELTEEIWPRVRVRCFEHSIKTKNNTTLQHFLPHIDDTCPQKLFLYAILTGNLPAMTKFFPLVDLNHINADYSDFWDFSANESQLFMLMSSLTDHLNPNAFLFPIYSSFSRDSKLGTFALVCAIKALQVPAARFLIEHGATIGTRVLFISPTLVENRWARVFFPHETATCSCCVNVTQTLAKSRSKTMVIATLSRISYVDVRRLIEGGLEVPTRRTRWCTRSNWWRGGWKPDPLREMNARIITAIHIPASIWDGGYEDQGVDKEEMLDRLEQMKNLMKRHHLPTVYTYSSLYET